MGASCLAPCQTVQARSARAYIALPRRRLPHVITLKTTGCGTRRVLGSVYAPPASEEKPKAKTARLTRGRSGVRPTKRMEPPGRRRYGDGDVKSRLQREGAM